MDKKKDMLETKIYKLLLKFSIPAIIGLLVNALYNIVDSMFVGQGVGELALAGVTVCAPIVLTFMACIMLIGMGATSLISIRLGEGKKEEAEFIIANALSILLILGIILTIIGLIFLEPILRFFGASNELLPYAKDYMQIILMGTLFLTISTGMNNFIRAEGNPKVAMNSMLIGTVTNIILDYIFIFKFKWGIKGAAFATIISYGVTTVWVLYYFLSGKSTLRIKLGNLKPKNEIIKIILIMGFPTFILQVTSSIQQMVLNRRLSLYGGDLSIAVIGIIMSVTTFLVMPAMGITQGAQPIMGYNFGARRHDRVKEILKLSILFATFIISIGYIVAMIWPEPIIRAFNNNPELIELGTHAMRIFFRFMPLVGLQMVSSAYLQATGKPNQATLLGLSRQIFIFIPLLIIMPYFMGIEGVWWSAPFSDLGAFVLTGLWLWVDIRKDRIDISISAKDDKAVNIEQG